MSLIIQTIASDKKIIATKEVEEIYKRTRADKLCGGSCQRDAP